MVPIEELRVGDRVRIVDKWDANTGEASDGSMDKYLGTIMTIRKFDGGDAKMIEDVDDHGGWYWNEYCIDYVIRDDGINVDDYI